MTSKKQIIYPIAIIILGVVGFIAFSSMKKPPEEKPATDNTQLVSVAPVIVEPVSIEVSSYGIVSSKNETELVSQVSGVVVELSDKFQRGGFVNKGDLLAKIDPSDYEAALIEAQANLASAKASLEQEKAQGQVAADEWRRISKEPPSSLSLRKPQLAQELARVKASEAAVKRAKRNLERTNIIAPYDALVASRNIGLGSFASMGTNLGKVMSISTAEIRLPVANNQLQYLIDQGNGAVVELTADSAGQTMTWQGTIVRNEGVVDSKSRMSYLVAEIADPYARTAEHEALKFGSYVNAKIAGIKVAEASIVPRHLINNGRVAVLSADKTLQYKTIEIIREDGRDVIVGDGLDSGDQLIITALDYPVEGMKLALPGDKKKQSDIADEASETQVAMKKD